MSSYGWFVEFREIHNRIAWRSLYRFGYQSCWPQFLVFLGKPWENHFISLCCNPTSLMVMGNGINRITPREGQSKTASDERQAGQNIPNFFPYCTGGSWIPDPSTPLTCRVAAVTEERPAAGTWMKDEVPWYPGLDRMRKEPASHTPGLGKDVIFIPERALCLDKLRRTANFPGSLRIFSLQVRMNLQPHREQRELWHQIHHSHGSLGVWVHSILVYSWVLGFFQTALHWKFFDRSWLSDSLRSWK